jgi:hypothetical protein
VADSPRGNANAARSASIRDRPTIMTDLTGFPEELARTLAGQSTESLSRPASDGGWGVIENLCHLRDWEEVNGERIRLIAEEDRPSLPAYDDELWALERDYRGQDPWRTLTTFTERRAQLVDFLAQLPDDAWARVGLHATRGEITLRWLADHICDHDDLHLAQIRDALA